MDAIEGIFSQSQNVDIEMLAIDLLRPQISRVKIYFRSQDTDFASVMRIMTLNGRVRNEAIVKGLKELRLLWDELFHTTAEEGLPPVIHRTAGILYYVELKIGTNVPAVKVYLPVRQYVANDQHVVAYLGRYLCKIGAEEKFAGYRHVLKHNL